MIDLIIWIALTMSIAPAVLAVYIFSVLVNSGGMVSIPADKYNELELIASICILCILVIAWGGFTIRKLRR